MRVTLDALDKQIACANRTIGTIRDALAADALTRGVTPRPVYTFVASDTAYGMEKATQVLPPGLGLGLGVGVGLGWAWVWMWVWLWAWTWA